MAKIGIEYVVAAGLLEHDGYVTFDSPREIGPAANVSVTPTDNNLQDYGDDRMVASDVSTNGGTISIEINELTMENEAWILGHEVRQGRLARTGGDWILRTQDDVAPFVTIAFIGKSADESGNRIYRVRVLLKCKLKDPENEYHTKEENVTFIHTTLEGDYFPLDAHVETVDNKSYESIEEAKAAIDYFFATKNYLISDADSVTIEDGNGAIMLAAIV